MKKLNQFALLSLVTATLVLQSCTKDEIITANIDQELLTANAQIDLSNELDFTTGVDVANENNTYSSRNENTVMTTPPCATITVNNTTPGVFPKIFTVDFGTGCLYNGVLRSGILTITFTNYFTAFGSTMTVERSNYYVNSRKIEGTVVYQNQTTNAQIPKWTRTVTNGKLTTITGTIFNFSGTRTVQQTEGVSTLLLGDNVYEVLSGTHTVSRPNGTPLTVTVTEKLIKKYACNYISQGKLNLQGSLLDGVLDYGNNTCDNEATYTHSNGVVYNVSL